MKFIILTLLFGLTSYAEEKDCVETVDTKVESKDINTPVPQHLRGATILIKKADGTIQEVEAENFKVVPRKQQFIVSKKEKVVVNCDKKCDELKRNRLSLLVGRGAQRGLNNTQVSPTLVEVENNVGLLIGLQYQRLITDTVSLGVQAISNNSALGMVGIDF